SHAALVGSIATVVRCPPRCALFPYATLFRSVGWAGAGSPAGPGAATAGDAGRSPWRRIPGRAVAYRRVPARRITAQSPRCTPARSEEHTSELQSRENLVCRLLLEKKKTGMYA